MNKKSAYRDTNAFVLFFAVIALFFLTALVLQAVWNEGFVPAGISSVTIEYDTAAWLALAYYMFFSSMKLSSPKN